MEYPKIHTLWKRGEDHKIIEGDYSKPEFASIKTWRVQEKIDGTNVRIFINCDKGVEIKGRTNEALLHPKLIKLIEEKHYYNQTLPIGNMILFGEGFGAGIQKGGIYRKDMSFILFDVYANGRWSTREEVNDIAKLLDLEQPADLGSMTQDDIVSFVKSKPRGRYNNEGYIMEGVVVRSEPLMRYNTQSADPIVWKLKVKDFHESYRTSKES
jgi:ATP-dependent RNA circularization protein (DNA/RNA ligase family)